MIYTAKEIQNSFLKYFENKSHVLISGSSVIPQDDNTLLFTNAGMNQFKNYFTGVALSPYKSVVTSQRCIRAGGKHNDLDQVGFTSRHLTHFSMLGNFSFDSYFKKEAIVFAWDYLTNIIKLNRDLLYVTIYKDDEEAFSIWKNDIKIDESRIFRLGEKDNFWQMGDVGPCGPCSEIYFDKGIKTDLDAISFPGDDRSDRFMEIWNLVFMQYEKQVDGSLVPLKKVGIDTGMGLERLVSVVQKKDSVFQTDLFMPLINYIQEQSGKMYDGELMPAFHVLCDHLRTASLLIYEGVLPGNEGRGYVLRKIIRRALLFSRKISDKNSFFASLVGFFVSKENLLYSDLLDKKEIIYDSILHESIRFFGNLDLGINLFIDFAEKQIKTKKFLGIDAFTLYDTYGFPLEITIILAQEKGMVVDIEEYEEEMLKQKNRSRENQKFKSNAIKNVISDIKTQFLGYTQFSCEGIIKAIYIDGNFVEKTIPNKIAVLILNKTVFYPTGGGQIYDSGNISKKDNFATVLEAKKYNEAIGLTINSDFVFALGDSILQAIDIDKRLESQKNHSAVHLLHHFISIYFNDNTIYQNGSYVCDEYFTLDVVMKHDVTYQDKKNLEAMINEAISQGASIISRNMTLAEAEKIGAVAQFTEKYNKDNVRVIDIQGITLDLCGGCHANNTKDIGLFILKEVVSGGAGIKRFVGIVGKSAYEYLRQLEEIILNIKMNYSCPIEKIEYELGKKEELQKIKNKEIDDIKIEYALCFADSLIKSNVSGSKIFVELPLTLKSYERYIAEKINKLYLICLFYIKQSEGVYLLYCSVSENLSKEEQVVLEHFLYTVLQFKGRFKNNIYQGLIKCTDKNIFNTINF